MQFLQSARAPGRERECSFEKVLLNCLTMENLTVNQVTSLLREHDLPEVLLDILSGKFPTWKHASIVY